MNELISTTAAAVNIFAAMLLAQAAWHKLTDSKAFGAALQEYALVPEFALAPAAKLLPLAELALAVMLLSPLAAIGAQLAAVLLAMYGMAMAMVLSRGQKLSNCACGSLQEKHALGGYQIWRNALLVALLLAASFVPAFASIAMLWQWVLALVLAAVMLLLYAAADQIHINYQNKKQLDLRYE